MYDLLFSPPWYLLSLVTIVGLVIAYLSNKRLDTRTRNMGLRIVAVAIVWFITGWLVETPKEAADAGMHRMVKAVVAADQQAMRRELAPEVALGSLGRDEVVAFLASVSEEWGLKSITITGLDMEERGTEVVATLRVISQHDAAKLSGIPALRSDFQVIFANHPQHSPDTPAWQITQITPLKLGDTDIQEVARKYFSKHK
jgi:hypothetical protein